MLVQTTVEFSAAHRLSFHKGQCKNLHGHTWKVEVAVWQAEYKDMVVDFGEIKSIIREELDHKVLVYEQDDPLVEATHFFPRKLFTFETTAENIAMWIKLVMIERFFGGEDPLYMERSAVEVVVYESANSFARC